MKLIEFYQVWISPFKKPSCRYYPTCSAYSLLLFKMSSPLYALFFSIIRVFRCNPWVKGGCDYPLVKITLHKIEYQPIHLSYWIVPLKPLIPKIFSNKPIQIWAYILLKD